MTGARRWVLTVLVACAVGLLWTAAAIAAPRAGVVGASGASTSSASVTTVEGDAAYVVVLHEGVELPGASTSRLERELGFQAHLRYGAALKGFAARLTPTQVTRLRAAPDVAYVAPDTTFHASATTPVARGDTVPAGIRRVRAATLTEAHAASTVAVAVVDTGLDLANADLNAASGTNCIRPGTAAQDDHGHGTHVGGTLAGRNTGAGVVGVAPSTRLYAVKVLGAKGTGSLSQMVCGVDWVTANAASLNIKVVNMSINAAGANDDDCGQTNADPLHQAVCASVQAGVTYVVSAGNSGTDFATSVPAAYPEVLTVTAMTDTDGQPGGKGAAPSCSKVQVDDKFATYSNYATASSEVAHAIAGPGTCVISTKRGGGTTTLSGTSMAAPHVAGAAALCFGNGGSPGPCAGMTPQQVGQKLRDDAATAAQNLGFSGDPLRPVSGKHFGYLASIAGY